MKQSAGLLFFKHSDKELQVLLVHPGGPFWIKKDIGAWSIPKGEIDLAEDPLTAAIRETKEELGVDAEGNFIELVPSKQKSGKLVLAWAIDMDVDVAKITSNEFEMEWPPKSGKRKSFPEVDRAEWFCVAKAKEKIIPGQVSFIEQLIELLEHDIKTY